MAVQPWEVSESANLHNESEVEKGFHWSMRLMSLLSLLTLAIYTYVLIDCKRAGRINASRRLSDKRRFTLSAIAFGMDLAISAYFGAITPKLIKVGGLTYDVKNTPRPLFWFFAITGLVPTASMSLTVLGARRWHLRIRERKGWLIFHATVALVAYVFWWLACLPVFFISIVGEKRALKLAKRWGMIKA
ncbi:MAG: hypothetical protein HXX08_19295 [Chloroflexi bacterium]|uniref:Uncharacterized protein n=1 Tax=Candidatus Chlorohelix allophototropha TaxID=3003348 RepID=A0A8T7M7K6_9CHLR|nr:hypothetical protein [Chloroflexota bacterium]WJW69911.1 hypothetical protein OZ401_003541 [Chloroflexota bacterium L227-S17]